MSEQELISQLKTGHLEVFESLFKQYYKGLCFYAYKLLDNEAEAEDIVQELFAKLWTNRADLNINTSIQAYLYGAVRNACFNQLKHRQVRTAYSNEQTERQDNLAYNPNTVDANELNILIESSIVNLPPERQKIFLLSRSEGLKYKDIAEQLGISIKTVEAQMGKALSYMRTALKDYLPLLSLIIAFFYALWFILEFRV